MADEIQNMIRVLTADDHPLMRDGIVTVLSTEADMAVIGHADNSEQAIALYRELQPDVVLMDLRMPGMGGVEATSRIREEFPDARIIIVTTFSGDALALAALRAGAQGYLVKLSLRHELIAAIRAVHAGGRHLQTQVASAIAFGATNSPLTDREVRVLQLAADGNSNKQIARELDIAEETVKGHMKMIFGKLGVTDRTHAVTSAARRGIIEL